MRFLEDPALNKVSVLLRHFDAGDRVLTGCLELFSTGESYLKEGKDGTSSEAVKLPVAQLGSDGKLSPSAPSKSKTIEGRVADMLTAMNCAYPDYDFSSLRASHFTQQTDFGEVYNSINYHLAYFVERCTPGFLQELWNAIRGAVNLEDVEIYSCSDPFSEEGSLFALDYFFFDNARRRILFVSSVTKSKCVAFSGPDDSDEEEDEEMYSDDDDDGR